MWWLKQMLYGKKQGLIAIGAVGLWLFSVAGLQAANTAGTSPAKKKMTEEQRVDGAFGPAAHLPVFLYFADPANQFLIGEERSGLESDDPVVFCRQLIEALIGGPVGGLGRTIPPKTKINAVFIDGKTVYVDFSRDVQEAHPGGIYSELMTIYSIVNTLVLNVDDVDQVKILIAGAEAETLSGHIDIRSPLHADMLLIR